jgi:hypothetical protein
MANEMERFIRDNRDAFDAHRPGPGVWEAIEKEIGTPMKDARVVRMRVFRLSAAAAVVVMLSLAAWLFTRQDTGAGAGPALASGQDPLVAQIDPQYAQMVAQFNGMIEAKQKEIQSIEKDNPELFQQFSADIRKLDSTYQVLRNTLPANPNKEQLLEAMISNLQMQIDVLNHQLRIIQQVKQPKSSNT